MFLFQTGIFASYDQSTTEQHRTARATLATSLDQPIRNQLETAYKPISNVIYSQGNESKRNALFSYFAETNDFKREQMKQSLYALFSQDLRQALDSLLLDMQLQGRVKGHVAFHVRNYLYSEQLLAGNMQAFQKGLEQGRLEAVSLGLDENIVLSDVVTGAAIKTGKTEAQVRDEYGERILDSALKAGFAPASVMKLAGQWKSKGPLNQIIPKQIFSNMVNTAQKMVQQAKDSMSESMGKYMEAREAVKRERETAGSKIGELVNSETEKDPANQSAFLERFYDYSIKTAQSNGMPVQQLYAHLNSNEQDCKLFADPNFFLKTPPVFVNSVA